MQTLTKISHGSARKPVSCAESIVASCERHHGPGCSFHDGRRRRNRNELHRRKLCSCQMERLASLNLPVRSEDDCIGTPSRSVRAARVIIAVKFNKVPLRPAGRRCQDNRWRPAQQSPTFDRRVQRYFARASVCGDHTRTNALTAKDFERVRLSAVKRGMTLDSLGW